MHRRPLPIQVQTTDIFSNLQTLDGSTLQVFGDELPSLFPEISDEPTFDPEADPEVDTEIRLADDRRFTRTPSSRLFRDYRSNADAYRHLEPMPKPGESLHGIISGRYALFELIPAIIEHAGAIEDLHIATLSFNKNNAHDLLQLIDDGHIRKMSLLISYYFKSTSLETYMALVPQLKARGMRTVAMRTHIKLILLKMANGTNYVVESSANLRSSVNLEGFVLTNCPELYRFHHDWIEGELLNGKELG
jgi:hypothetical protein